MDQKIISKGIRFPDPLPKKIRTINGDEEGCLQICHTRDWIRKLPAAFSPQRVATKIVSQGIIFPDPLPETLGEEGCLQLFNPRDWIIKLSHKG